MIRINLLPEAKKKEVGLSGGSQAWVVIYVVSAVLCCLLCGVVYWKYDSELEEKLASNISLQTEIKRADEQNTNLDEIKAKLEKSKKFEEVIKGLQSARSGPTRVLMELSRILSPGGGPSIEEQRLEKLRQDNPLAGYNASWDIRRLWLTLFKEKDRHCEIEGLGKTNEDVAEFLRRLALSEVFQAVALQSTKAVPDPDTKQPVVSFSLTCDVRY
ncbi:MAG: PilN domain-containing protein [Deltaproteobacteria bacterium]|nr:PilN domain-containing protein [Deltaproteobacteria bacterium]